jgi:hypothetical protein
MKVKEWVINQIATKPFGGLVGITLILIVAIIIAII